MWRVIPTSTNGERNRQKVRDARILAPATCISRGSPIRMRARKLMYRATLRNRVHLQTNISHSTKDDPIEAVCIIHDQKNLHARTKLLHLDASLIVMRIRCMHQRLVAHYWLFAEHSPPEAETQPFCRSEP
mmetsp:Transcript_11902/g.32751  ORF Transcript_11902/g.32751 Transcript_11902/m.32751 type:complete len:131 (+) Transcript_11902:339-731(+)